MIGLTGILSIDVTTFILAIAVLTFVHIPQPPRTLEGVQLQGNILQEAIFGFRYIFARPSLLGLQLIFFFGNLFSGIAYTVLAPWCYPARATIVSVSASSCLQERSAA